MKALFICSEYPFPARNGITIPVSNYVKIFKKLGVGVDILTLTKSTNVIPNSNYKSDIWYEIRTNRFKRILNEIILRKPYCMKSDGFRKFWEQEHIFKKEYDIIVASPFMALDVALIVQNLQVGFYNKAPKLIAAISDCYTAELWNVGREINFFGKRLFGLKGLISKVRSLIMRRFEVEYLLKSDSIFVQSELDKNWLNRISKNSLNSKISIVTNGVDESLINLKPHVGGKIKNFCFVADMNVLHYERNFIWFYERVWKKIILKEDVKLYIYTKPISSKNNFWVGLKLKDDIIIVDSFVKDIVDIYTDKDVAIAPIFKNYGFINKVGEAIAAGIIVIGDRSAFNAITGFKNNLNGFIFNEELDMFQIIMTLFEDKKMVDIVKINAKKLAKAELSWKNKEVKVKSILTGFGLDV